MAIIRDADAGQECLQRNRLKKRGQTRVDRALRRKRRNKARAEHFIPDWQQNRAEYLRFLNT
jgi:hypothetical protein